MAANINEIIKAVGNAVIENKQFLTDLDQAIGDGDHGINMARGFENVFKKIDALGEGKDIGTILKTVGMALISSVGGASGPLYGTAFLRAAVPAKDKTEIDLDTAIAMIEAALKGIQDRGKAQQGEKTMVDSLLPLKDAFVAGKAAGKSLLECLADGVKAAEDGVEYTKTIIATKGRASYVGERSIGHQDAGATSLTLMFKTLYEYLSK
jgi:dihydroxyacetone kinase-like protein